MKKLDITPVLDFVKGKVGAARDVRRGILDGDPVTISIRGNIAASVGRRSDRGTPLTDTADIDLDVALIDVIAVAAAAAVLIAIVRGVREMIDAISG